MYCGDAETSGMIALDDGFQFDHDGRGRTAQWERDGAIINASWDGMKNGNTVYVVEVRA